MKNVTSLLISFLIIIFLIGNIIPQVKTQSVLDGLVSATETSLIVKIDTWDTELNFHNQTIKYQFSDKNAIGCFSIDGGIKWKRGIVTVEALEMLFKKGGILKISDSFDVTSNCPIENGETATITFPEILPRPKLDKLCANYAIHADKTGNTDGNWALSKKLSNEHIFKGYEISLEGKTWCLVPENGLPIVSATYFVRSSAFESNGKYIPASKPIKVKLAGVQKAPKFKMNYKTEKIKMKLGYVVYAGDSTILPEMVESAVDVIIASGSSVTTKSPNINIDFSAYLAEQPVKITFWKAATSKKPASKKQEIMLAPRAVIKSEYLKATNGKLNFPKKYEIYNGTKWGGIPKITETSSFQIRMKATSKSTGLSDSGNAKSNNGTIKIGWGQIKAENSGKLAKFGVTAATITGLMPGGDNFVDYGFSEEEPIWVNQKNIIQFNEYANTADGLKKHYILTENVVVNSEKIISDDCFSSSNWIPVGNEETPFTGSFNGNNFKINNAVILQRNDGKLGVFGCISNTGKLINLKVHGVIEGQSNYIMGGLAVYNYGLIENCDVEFWMGGSKSNSNLVIGGIVAKNYGMIIKSGIKNTEMYNEIFANEEVYKGQIAVYNEGIIEDCYTFTNVPTMESWSSFGGATNVGGLVTFNSGTINRCYSLFTMYAKESSVSTAVQNSKVGGISVVNTGIISNCFVYAGIEMFDAGDVFGRVCLNNNSGMLLNNYVSNKSGLVVNDGIDLIFSPFPSGAYPESIQGCDVTELEYQTQSWWENVLKFDFSSTWTWDNKLKYPVIE